MNRNVLFRIRLASILLPVTLIPVTEPTAYAAESANKYSMGDRVVQRERDFKVRVGQEGIERKVPLDIWCVEKVDGPKLWMRAMHVGIIGWGRADQVASVEHAIPFFSDQIRDYPNDAFARVIRAELWRDKSEFAKALADCNEAVRIDPQYSLAYESRAKIWLQRTEFDKAIIDCDAVIRLDPQCARAYSMRGAALAFKHSYDKAIIDFDQAIRLDPQQSAAFDNRGCMWLKKKEYDKAVTDFSAAIRINPNNAAAYSNRASAWNNKGEYDKSIANCNLAIRLESRDANAYCHRGYAWMYKGDHDRAMADLNEAIRLDPVAVSAYRNRAHIWFQKNEFDKAIADLGQSIRLDPHAADTYHCRALVWRARQEYDKAISDCTSAIQLNPDDADSYSLRASVWRYKQQFDKVIADCTAAIQLKPDNAYVFELRADAWSHKQEFDKVIADCTAAIRVDPKRATSYRNRGGTWLWKREYDKAIDDYSEAIRLDPRNPDAYANRGVAWNQKGDKAKATADYTTCIGLDPTFGLPRGDQGSVPPQVKDHRQDIDEFLRTVPLEHVTKPISDEHIKLVAGAAPTISLPINMVPARIDQNGIPVAVTANSTLETQRLTRETITFIQATTKNAATHEQFKANFTSYVPGSDAFFRGEFDAAIAECTTWLSRHSECTQAYLIRARGYSAKGQYRDALADLRNVNRLDPQDAFAWDLAAQITGAGPDDDLRDGKDAVASATTACELTEWKKASYLDTLAAAYAEAGDFAGAVKWQTRAIELCIDKNDKEERSARLNSYRDRRPYRDTKPRGQRDSESDSAPLETKELTIKSTEFFPLMSLEHTTARASENRVVATTLDATPDFNPAEIVPAPTNDVATWAGVNSDSATGSEPTFHEKTAHLRLTNDASEARKRIETILRSEYPGLDELARGDVDAAIEQISGWLVVNPKAVLGYVNRGAAWYRKGEYARALADYERVVQLDPRNACSLNLVAHIRAMCPDDRVRDGKKAVESATMACELTEWLDASYIDTLAAAYAESGDFTTAMKWATTALGLRKDPEERDWSRWQLKLYQEGKPCREVMK